MLYDQFYENFPAGSPDDDHRTALRLRAVGKRDFVFSRLRGKSNVVAIRGITDVHGAVPVSVPSTGSRTPFLLHASPERRKPHTIKCSRVAIFDDKGQRHWLDLRGQQNGFRVEEVTISSRPVNFARVREGKRDFIAMVDAWFDGVLTVTDSSLFEHALAHGIGRRTAYGLGMLLLPYLTGEQNACI